jgi:hypothetical protein
VKVAVPPADKFIVVGVMAIDVSTGAITFRLAGGEVFPLEEAVIAVPPTATPVATPLLAIVAIPVFPDAQVTVLVMSAVDPSV